MTVDGTLARAAADLAAGDGVLARRRLSDLLTSHPARLDVRDALAAAYRADGHTAQAGRWSYLAEHRDPAEQDAFLRAYGHDPFRLMTALRWRGPEDDAATEVARERLRALRAQAEREAGRRVPWEAPRRPEPLVTPRRVGRVLAALLAATVVVLGVVELVGLVVRGVQALL